MVEKVPIENAPVNVTFYYPEGGKQGWRIAGLKTDDSGIATADYIVKDAKPNEVIRVEVEAVVAGKVYSTSTWFRVWW